ncbi:Abc transporter a family member [Thalictrum thalictroides]|uniref:Abc transporter a family member n=1 Tax=Thalictrum thalictroides TaxID=46969 RepID=A0A7J6V3D2_THATH|nr:Abc transporter a family member [Thalictrum thalictroides]
MNDSRHAGGGGRGEEPPSFKVQSDAFLRKSLILQKRNIRSNIGLLTFPVLIFAVAGIYNFKESKYTPTKNFPKCDCTCIKDGGGGGGGNGNSCKVVCTSDPPEGQNFCPIPNPVLQPPLLQLPETNFFAVRTDPIKFPGLPYNVCKNTSSCPVTILVTGTNRSLAKGLAANFFPKEVYLNRSSIVEDWSALILGTSVNMKGDEELSMSDVSYIIQSQCPPNNITEKMMATRSKKLSSPLLQIIPKCLRGKYLWRRSSSVINEELFKGFKDENQIAAAYDFLNSDEKNFNVSIWYNATDFHSPGPRRVTPLSNVVSNAYLKYFKGLGVKSEYQFIQDMPKPGTLDPEIDKALEGKATANLISKYVIMWLITNLLPVITTAVVYEKQQKLRIMMKMHGLGDGSYWFVTYAYYLILSISYVMCFMVCGFIARLDIFIKNDYSIQALFYFIYINLQIATAFLLSTLLSSVKMASIIGFVCVIGSVAVGLLNFIPNVQDKSYPRRGILLMELFPFFSLLRGLYDLEDSSDPSNLLNVGMKWEDMNDRLIGMKEVLIVMSIEWCVFLILTFYLDQVVSTGSGVKKHPLFFLQIFQKKRPNKPRQESVEMEKPDILNERKKVEELLLNPSMTHTVICDNLEKIYPGMDGNPDKYAVRGFSLAIPQGECFGMLGPNGAGKTSSISMMIGQTEPTSGTAYIQNLDIRTDMDKIYTSMGVCPQHDLLWEAMTGREHLLFYGRLKNLREPFLTQTVDESLKSLNLHGVGDKQVKQYSGGMKRRLSVGISLIGNPKVVYLDEPSTGLDPASRNLLWTVVKRAKKKCAIILTTHSMEEAEVLCDRLGIFVDGRFQCIGNPKELKARYGGYYVLQLTTSSAVEEEVGNLVHQLSPNANKIYHLSGTQKFQIPKEDTRIADFFLAVENAKKKIPIQAWGISDTTLEDVFIKVAQGAQPIKFAQ